MKKGIWALVAMILAVVLLVSVSGVWAQPDGSIECQVDMVYHDHDGTFQPYWLGTVSGCSLEGTVEYYADPTESPKQVGNGNVLHFYEIFIITPSSGGTISGSDAGVGVMANAKFNARGWVTAASEEWEHLVGYKYFEMGPMEFTFDPAFPWPIITVTDMVMRLEPTE